MTRLTWDERNFEVELDRGVFYPKNSPVEVWNGLFKIQEEAIDIEERIRYVDGLKVQRNLSCEDFSGVVEAYTYPPSLYAYFESEGELEFGLTYRVRTDQGYRTHLVYNMSLTPRAQSHRQEETSPFSWRFSTRPIPIPGLRPTSHLIIDSSEVHPDALSLLEDQLYGSEAATPRLPLPEEVFELFEDYAVLKVLDHGDGTFTVTGPDDMVEMLDATTFRVISPSAMYISPDTYTLSSF